MKNKRVKKVLLSVATALIWILILYPVFVFGRVKYAEAHSTYNQAINDKDHITIVYRENCSRCKRTLPIFFLKHGLTTKKFYVLNAKNLNPTQLDKLEVHITPVFRLGETSLNTTNNDYIQALWNKSK